ncbi:MAG: hypothetical protein COB10_12705 [Planctomycetota bacterium]|nr:MAG: hypothetical protein COB10_12705 [Planctomycetota bacterium]
MTGAVWFNFILAQVTGGFRTPEPFFDRYCSAGKVKMRACSLDPWQLTIDCEDAQPSARI